MATYLQLCQQAQREAGETTTGIVSVVGNVGRIGLICEWVANAWQAIQLENTLMRCLWRTYSTNAMNGVDVYQLPSDLSVLNVNSVKLDGALIAVEKWNASSILTPQVGKPIKAIMRPDGLLMLYPSPDTVYPLSIEYQSHPVLLVNNDDKPAIPDGLDKAIVWRAAMSYHAYFSEPDRLQSANYQYNQVLNMLLKNQGIGIGFGGGVPLV